MINATAVCMDGYNFYYGRIRGTRYNKWIDRVALFHRLLHEQDPESQVTLLR